MTLKFSFPSFRQPANIIFSGGSRKAIPHQFNPDQTVVFLSGSQGVRERIAGAWGDDSPFLDAQRVCIKPEGEPTREMVRMGARFLEAHTGINTIVGIGGGSVLDWCRLAWAESAGLLSDPAPASIQLKNVEASPDFCLVPTTPATGAEAAAVAVMSESDGRKVPVMGDVFLARHAVLDGQLIAGLSPAAVADSLGDLLSHAIESAVSIIRSPLAYDASLAALRRVIHQDSVGTDGSQADVLLEASMQAGIAASNASVGAAHAFAHSVARLGVRHGHANAIALPAVIESNGDCDAMRRLVDDLGMDSAVEFAGRVRSLTAASQTPQDHDLANQLKGPEREAILQTMASDVCMRTNPRRLSDDELLKLLDQIISEISG